MKLSNERIYEYQKIIMGMDELFDGQDTELIIPAVISYLAAAGAFSGVEKKKFISFIVAQIDRAYEELERRQV
jgi:hypothetical protein